MTTSVWLLELIATHILCEIPTPPKVIFFCSNRSPQNDLGTARPPKPGARGQEGLPFAESVGFLGSGERTVALNPLSLAEIGSNSRPLAVELQAAVPSDWERDVSQSKPQPNKRTYEMICFYLLGWASLAELEAHIEKLKHKPVQDTFRKAGFDTRIVDPLASSHFRKTLHPDAETDDNDLEAIVHAAVNGYGLASLPVDEVYKSLQALSRHRQNLVTQQARLKIQIRSLIHQAGIDGLAAHLRNCKIRFQARTLERVVAWSCTAADPSELSAIYTQQWQDLNSLRESFRQQVHAVQREMSGFLMKTPYILLLSVTGINVVSAGRLAGEAEPIEHYASARAINGQAWTVTRGVGTWG